jgi:hypothetical protein
MRRRTIGMTRGMGWQKLKKTFKLLQLPKTVRDEGKQDRRKEETYPPAKEKKRPTIHTHIVSAGMSGLSMFETEARTSG